ncbi:MAG: glycogen/starch/alpha-glucan phosphorylase [Clostridia bacterium]|nr:glycogen/starch/alpha-glucan phosphorylase [Clostridia bacterium]
MEHTFEQEIQTVLHYDAHTTIENATAKQLYNAVSKAAMARLQERWEQPKEGKRAAYFSAEFLVGRVVEANLLGMELLAETRELLAAHGVSTTVFEEIEDAALGNGGLGRLAACFLDSAATHGIPLDGYGIRYRYGLFRQSFENGFQQEQADDWTAFGDPWSVRREEQRVRIHFADEDVWAVPYDSPVIGYGGETVNTLRLWQAEALNAFDFTLFNEQKYEKAVRARNKAERISAVLYPNDDTDAGKKLRLKQQYFFSSASLQDILRRYKAHYGDDFSQLPDAYAIQLNDTHPTVAIPELLRLLVEEEGLPFDTALKLARRTFAYTNHTIMPEALEKWSIKLFRAVLPQVYRYVVRLQKALEAELAHKGITDVTPYAIVDGERIHMARMAIFATHSTNGVARLHTELLKTSALPEWYALYPERFQNKTNGITQRRFLALANPELAQLITDTIGNRWLTELDALTALEPYGDDPAFLNKLLDIRGRNKQRLAAYIREREGVELRQDFLLDVQIKRLHEYKRQLLNAFAVLDTYFALKDGTITEFMPTAYLFGAKAAPGYFRAKGIIKFINAIAEMIDSDPEVRDRMQVIFVSNYNVSYAEKLVPAADVSEQISTAGTEASGTGNMKFMLNGAVTLGTYDGANIEIVEQAGEENNYIFGARVEELDALREIYDPKALLARQPRLKRVVDTLIDGTFDDGGTGMFRELYTSLTEGASWHRPDQYFLLHDFSSYCEARLRVNRDYRDREAFARKGLMNIAHAGKFSSDRTVREYATQIWGI